MNEKLIPTIISICFVGFLAYAAIFMSPLEQIDVACKPFTIWPGKLVTAAVNLNDKDSAHKVNLSVEHGFGVCRRWLWNAFFDEKYQRLKAEGQTPREAAGK